MIRAGIIGGAGYTAGELIRILLNHPQAELRAVQSESQAGLRLDEVHGGIFGDSPLRFSEKISLEGLDVLFLCSAHGKSRAFWEGVTAPAGLKVIDLAQDFRDESDGYVYGLPEWQRERIRTATRVANPGCFATAIQLALLPLAQAGMLHGDVYVTALTGSTGAGVKPGATTHFSWRDANLSAYKVFTHQHLTEIRRDLGLVSPTPLPKIHFVPLRGDFTRGIFATVQLQCPGSREELLEVFGRFYADAAFTKVSAGPIDLKQVVNTNKCLLTLEKDDDTLAVFSAIDNLLKGASGQAVQNMNLMFGLEEDCGLRLKASAF